MAAVPRHRFYQAAALVMAVLVLFGFARTFYLRQWFDVPPISGLLVVHGVVFTAWFALFVVQTRLIASHNARLHRKVGPWGVALALIVVVTSLMTIVESASSPRMRPMGLNSQQFTFVPLIAILGFAGLFGAAVALRRRADLHRRLILLGMITLLGPPVARLLLVIGVKGGFLFVQTGVAAVFVAWFLLHDWFKHRVVHPIYAIGGALLVLSWPARFWVARTPEWEQVGRWVAGL